MNDLGPTRSLPSDARDDVPRVAISHALRREEALAAWLRDARRVAIGYSGGVDSAYLAALAAEVLRRIVARGVASGEFRPTALEQFPQALVAPAVVGLLWKTLFDHEQTLDIDGLLDTHLDLILHGLFLTR